QEVITEGETLEMCRTMLQAPCPLLLSCSLFSTLKNPAKPGRCTICQVLANDNYWLISQVKGQAA
ncbi:hypothetical protein QHH11_28085, partial [Aphanizomenon sp. PH219]|nr:hypothetical protein [Aphanizomenon sp. PH219]